MSYKVDYITPMPKTNAQQLRQLMKTHGLTLKDVAQIAGKSFSTVKAWLLPPDSKTYRNMPAQMLELLCYKLSDKSQKQKKPR